MDADGFIFLVGLQPAALQCGAAVLQCRVSVGSVGGSALSHGAALVAGRAALSRRCHRAVSRHNNTEVNFVNKW